MEDAAFRAPDGTAVPAVTGPEMREVDRAAVEDVGLSLLMMMEHAGRGLAGAVQELARDGSVTVVAGGGGNGGGGICAARHLRNHGRRVRVVLDRGPTALEGAPARQWRVLGGAATNRSAEDRTAIEEAAVVVDAVVGYGLQGPLRGRAAELVAIVNAADAPVVSLDVPSGTHATTGERPGDAVGPDLTVSLALPKAGLRGVGGELQLADIGIPDRVYELTGLAVERPFTGDVWRIRLGGAAARSTPSG